MKAHFIVWQQKGGRLEEGLESERSHEPITGVQGRPCSPPGVQITTHTGSCHCEAQGTLVQAHQPIRGQYGRVIDQSEAWGPGKKLTYRPCLRDAAEQCSGPDPGQTHLQIIIAFSFYYGAFRFQCNM